MEKEIKQVIDNTSFITTIYNEEKSVSNFLKSLFEQNYLPAEIVIVDGGSSDNTIEVIVDFFKNRIGGQFDIKLTEEKDLSNFKCFKNEKIIYELLLDIKPYSTSTEIKNKTRPSKIKVKIFNSCGSNISEGRNIAISHSSNRIICVSDGGCSLGKDWLYEITKYYFDNDKKWDVVGGFTHSISLTFLEKLLEICIMPGVREIDGKKFMPSSRNISFKKIAWEKVGGYPENLDYGEDMKFNFNLREHGFKIVFNPDAIVYWKMRENLNLIFKQFFRYSKGDALGKMYTYRHMIRFFSLFIFIILIILSIFVSPWVLLAFIPLMAFYIFKPALRINHAWMHIKNPVRRFILKICSFMLIIPMMLYIDSAKAAGYIYGKIKKRA